MATLYLIGTGLKAKDMTLEGLEAAKSSDKVYLESYTSILEDVKELEKVVGKKITLLSRQDVEQKPEKFMPVKGKTALLVIGDPMTATTHVDIVLRAEKKGLKTKIIHAPSIFTSVCESGLQIYSFGPAVSVPRPQQNFFPTIYYKKIRKNKEEGFHTLLLLDIGMTVREALKILKKVEGGKGKIFAENSKIIVFSRMGFKNQKIVYNTIKRIKDKKLSEPPHSIVIPGKLHFKEKEALERFTSKDLNF